MYWNRTKIKLTQTLLTAMIKRFYHYTSEDAIRQILDSGVLRPSYFSQYDTAHGEGWYLTDLSPENADVDLQEKLWGASVPHKVRCYIAFDIDERYIIECEKHKYLVSLKTIPDEIINLKWEYFENNSYYTAEKKL